jgi:hypothetical protein
LFARPRIVLPTVRAAYVRVVTAAVLLAVLLPTSATQVVQASSYSVVTNPPCTLTGNYAAVSYGTNPGEKAHLFECASGGFWYVKPTCEAQAGANAPSDPAEADISQCYVFVWNGSTYLTRLGFTNFATYPGPNNWSGWYVPAASTGVLKLSGYTVSSEVCATSWWYAGKTYWLGTPIPCAQSSIHALGA